MSLYAIKDKDGELRDVNGRTAKSEFGFGAFAFVHYGLAKNHQQSAYPDGHVVELVEKAEPMEVSGGAGEWLADLREELAHGYTANSANYYVTKLKCQHDMSIEDIFRALDVGWTVKQPKRWYVKVPKEWFGTGTLKRFYKYNDGGIATIANVAADNTADEQFTAEEIDKYHLGGFETVEVED